MTTPAGLLADLDVEVVPDADLGRLTWYGVGGPADLLVRPATVEAAAAIVARCRRDGVPLRILGSGANLLVDDLGVAGVVMRLDAPAFREVRANAAGEVEALRVMAGVDLARLVTDAARSGQAGLEVLGGIPASVGGAIRMNAGGRFGAIGDLVERLDCITRGGELVSYPASELRFDYRRTNIPDPVIVSAVLRVEPDDPVRVRERLKEVFAYKKRSQPLAEHSAGCAFRNPWDPVREERVSAGRLIDETGLKGLRIGGAEVSVVHANFVLVHPGARARDVAELLAEIRRRVFDRTGIELEPEVVHWTRDDEADR